MRLLAFVCAACLAACPLRAEEPPAGAVPIGGRWFARQGDDKATYFFRDGERFVDLFSYHQRDSNNDGIDEVRLRHEPGYLVVESQGYPNHPTALFPNSGNPNSIRVQEFTFRLPLEPRRAEEITTLPMGPIGMALNGVVFFNPFEQGGMNAVEGYSEVWLDSCCGHPQQTGVYHYHKYPTCVKSPFPDDGHTHSPVIGFAFDGFPVHGPYESDGVMARDVEGERALDVCNGHEDPDRGYHYHVTPERFPYVIGGYRGVPEPTNNRGIARAGTGPIEDNARGESDLERVVNDVRPGSVSRGGRRTVSIVLDPRQATRGPVPVEKPSWVQIGPYEAVAVERAGNTVKAEFEIPEDAALGVLLDCHLEFDTGGRMRALKRNAVLRIVE
ncbi:MAG: YHYH protein [Planctomycetes bacterium]|nr:YHYH protein [Planctomycetota bacterium]